MKKCTYVRSGSSGLETQVAKMNWSRVGTETRVRRNGSESAAEPAVDFAMTPNERASISSRPKPKGANKKSSPNTSKHYRRRNNKSAALKGGNVVFNSENSEIQKTYIAQKMSDDNKALDIYFAKRKPDDLINRKLRRSINFEGGRLLGVDKTAGKPVRVCVGPDGPYVERGTTRCFLPKSWKPKSVNLEKALRLLSLPRKVGTHPEDKAPIWVGLDKFGAYLEHSGTYAVLPEADDVFTVDMHRALSLITQQRFRSGR